MLVRENKLQVCAVVKINLYQSKVGVIVSVIHQGQSFSWTKSSLNKTWFYFNAKRLVAIKCM